MDNFNALEVKNKCVEWIRNWFKYNGKNCNAVIGISGGADSSIVAALCVEALGKDRVVGVLMPNGEQADIDDAIKLVRHLGISNITVNMHTPVQALRMGLALGGFSDDSVDFTKIGLSEQTEINLPPRIRMATLYAVSQSLNGRVANTCNLSEDWIGYSTRWGDSVGDFSPLSNLTKTEVKQIGDVLDLPKDLVYKVPSDGLCGKTDEDNFGFTYEVLDRYIRTGEIDDVKTKEKIDTMHKKNLFKLKMMPSFTL